MSINRSKAFDRQLGVAPEQTGKDRRLYMALDLRIDRLAEWPRTPDAPLVAYHRTELLQPDSGSHLHQLLLAPSPAGNFMSGGGAHCADRAAPGHGAAVGDDYRHRDSHQAAAAGRTVLLPGARLCSLRKIQRTPGPW